MHTRGRSVGVVKMLVGVAKRGEVYSTLESEKNARSSYGCDCEGGGVVLVVIQFSSF